MLGPDLVLVWNLLLGFTKEGKAPRSHTKLPSDYFNDYLQRATQTTGARCVLTETIQCKHRFYTHLCESSTAADEWEQVGLGFSSGAARVELVSKDRKMIQGAVSCKQHVRTIDDSHTDRRLYVLKSSETRSFIYVWLYINLWATDDAPLHTRNCCIWKYSFVQLDLTFVKMFGLIVWYLCFSLNAKTRFVGISPGVRFTSQGLNYSSYTIKLHKVPPGGDKTLHWGSCTATQTQDGITEDCAGWAEARSLVESSLQDALEREGDKLEALARVELVLELNPERKREKTVWLNIHTSMYESCPVKAFLN